MGSALNDAKAAAQDILDVVDGNPAGLDAGLTTSVGVLAQQIKQDLLDIEAQNAKESPTDRWPRFHGATASAEPLVMKVPADVVGIAVGPGINYEAVDGRIFVDPDHEAQVRGTGLILP